jgi:hypothetical protein
MSKARMAQPGYYVEYLGNKVNHQPSNFDIIHISKDLKCKYIRNWDWGQFASMFSEQWETLVWSCAPTKKQVGISQSLVGEGTRYLYFKDHDALVNSMNYLPECAKEKSPLDV